MKTTSYYLVNMKTGNSKGYGFLEFESEDVAKIAAETMNNYLFGERLLKCKFSCFTCGITWMLLLIGAGGGGDTLLSSVGVPLPPGILHKNEENASNSDLRNSRKRQGPTPVCTPTFLEKRKSEAAAMTDDKDDEIVFKQPVSGAEETPAAQTPKGSRKKRRRKANQ
ncbi:MKI67 FHA domain-interacting nucleolar phosphoprotein [Camelus ferus]|nr:MKI67 FHA domain-interacting nucleolar phosphoprotein [Camelus ferus]